ncbi:hypothetical protein SAMN04487857_111110 [Pseudomonas sp. ok272]|uniref:hypothetical protein n=1 Tax=unclassified Pseudomonas TaxID=196821 RepID=UPI0008BB5097|nr:MULTISPECIES: hypothetical protein [unclassified Pseudomonas]SEN18889.1 hypothetical protein SAMN04487857_111110 [Pseudomonas sp. ok272]SFN10905.1 hypothetical protein SAMN04487858_112110 [Pseudomonas sp. ok602]
MSDETFSLDQLYDAIEQHLQAHLPGVEAVAFWPQIEENQGIPLPSVFLELTQMEPAQDIGTGETALKCTIEARIIVDPIRSAHHQQAMQLASQLAVLLRAQSWGLAVDPAEFVQATQDWTRPELDGYTVWLVEWTQTVYLGTEQWPWPDQPPGTLVFGFNHDTGPGHEADYIKPEELQ